MAVNMRKSSMTGSWAVWNSFLSVQPWTWIWFPSLDFILCIHSIDWALTTCWAQFYVLRRQQATKWIKILLCRPSASSQSFWVHFCPLRESGLCRSHTLPGSLLQNAEMDQLCSLCSTQPSHGEPDLQQTKSWAQDWESTFMSFYFLSLSLVIQIFEYLLCIRCNELWMPWTGRRHCLGQR